MVMKKHLVVFYYAVCLVLFLVGFFRLYSYNSNNAANIRFVTCETAFKSKCTNPGQCSYNNAYSASECRIFCETKYDFNGVDRITRMKAECGKWKDDGGSSQTGGGSNLVDPLDNGFTPLDASNEPMW